MSENDINGTRFDRRANMQRRFLELVSHQKEQDKDKTSFEIRPRAPSESRVVIDLPLLQDERLRDVYITSTKGLRIGRVLEDLDAMAGEISYKHAEGFSALRSVAIVTATCDRIELVKPISLVDLRFDGWVTWVGNSSMEVRIEVQQKKSIEATEFDVCAVAYFVMVARDYKKGGSAPVHTLNIVTEQDGKLYEQGQKNQARRKSSAEKALIRTPPSEGELQLVHQIFINAQSLKMNSSDSSDHKFMNQSCMCSTKVMHPQQKNLHNKIFGGYLMREACDIAWSAAYVFGQHEPEFMSLDDNHFIKPVDVGTIVNFNAKVVFVHDDIITVRVEAQVIDPKSSKRQTTNVFHFGFKTATSKKVIPETYEEAMLYIEGKRIYEKKLHSPNGLDKQ
ncbi:Acot9 [Acrasis kona]|uniref:Acot9 n=1 Tax=Acrasis kona TaxID=1008807 RepID=A0AAW2ZN85_9EUKA